MRGRVTALAWFLLLLSWSFADAQSYPIRAINLVVPFSAGSAADVLARVSTSRANAQFIVENVPGAAGRIGMDRVANARPDGYTLLFRSQGVVPNQGLVGVSLIATSQLVLVAYPQFDAKNLHDVISSLRSKPNQITIASAGIGTTSHYAIEVLSKIFGVRPTHLPYRTGIEALTNVVVGQAPLAFGSLGPSLPLIAEGKIRAIATTGEVRSRNLPSVATFAEAGAQGMSVLEWVGVFAPHGTAESIVSAAGRLILNATTDPSVEERFAQSGFVRASLVAKILTGSLLQSSGRMASRDRIAANQKPAPI